MSTQTILGSGAVNNNHGTIKGVGSVTNSNFGTTTLATQALGNKAGKAGPYPYAANGVQALLYGNGVAITSILQSSSTGFCKITKASHGLVVGQHIVVSGCDNAPYNTIHTVTVVLSSSTVQTDIAYDVNSTVTPGVYKLFSGNFGTMTSRGFIGMVIGNQIAGVASTLQQSPAADYNRQAYGVSHGSYMLGITDWSYITGRPTYNGNRGVLNQYHNITSNNDTLANEPRPTRAVPGRLVYFYSNQDAASTASYKPKTGS
jgi:hypothetical protein